jgi:hypothetical protein
LSCKGIIEELADILVNLWNNGENEAVLIEGGPNPESDNISLADVCLSSSNPSNSGITSGNSGNSFGNSGNSSGNSGNSSGNSNNPPSTGNAFLFYFDEVIRGEQKIADRIAGKYNFNPNANVSDPIRVDMNGVYREDVFKSLCTRETRAIIAAVNQYSSNTEPTVPVCGLKSEIPEKQQMKSCRYLPENTLLIRSENNDKVVYESAKNTIENLTKIKEALNKFKTTEKNIPVRPFSGHVVF